MSSRNFIKFSIILFLTYLQISLLYTSNHTLWAGFDYDNHEYRYTVFIPHHNNSQIIISACQDNLCKVITESPYSRLTWIQFFERESGFNFKVNINKLKKTDPKWQYTFWHNSFFNLNLNEKIEILNFQPIKIGLRKI